MHWYDLYSLIYIDILIYRPYCCSWLELVDVEYDHLAGHSGEMLRFAIMRYRRFEVTLRRRKIAHERAYAESQLAIQQHRARQLDNRRLLRLIDEYLVHSAAVCSKE